MTTTASCKVFAILMPERAVTALTIIDALPDTRNYQAILGTNTAGAVAGLQSKFSWLTVVNAGALAATWQAEGLSQYTTLQLNFALLKGAAVLLLKNVPEAQLSQLQQALETILSGTEAKYLCDGGQGTVMFALSPSGQMQELVGLPGEILGTAGPEGNGGGVSASPPLAPTPSPRPPLPSPILPPTHRPPSPPPTLPLPVSPPFMRPILPVPPSQPTHEPQEVQRYTEVQYPEQVQPEQIFELKVGLVRQAPADPLNPHPQAVQVLTTVDSTGQSTGAEPVKVILTATMFDLPDPNHGELQVYADKDTDPISFSIKSKPGVSGPQPINVTFQQGWQSLGEVVAVIKVVADQEGIAPVSAVNEYMTLRVADALLSVGLTAPDVVLYVTCSKNQGFDTLSYRYEWVQKNWSPVDAGKIDLQSSVEGFVEALYARLSQFAQPATPGQPRGVESDQRELEKIGENLYDNLFTPDLKDFYKQFAPVAKTVLIFSNEPWIPWEVVKPWGLDLDQQLSDFLCARFQFSRWYVSREGRLIHPALAVQHLSAIIPATNLAAVNDEATYLNTLQQKWPPVVVQQVVPLHAAEVLSLLEEGTIEMFHFATHGMLQPNTPTVATIFLGQDKLHVSDLVGTDIVKGLTTSAPLIFMNACHSGRQGEGLSQLEGWADRFINFGCSGFIGANWEIDDKLAAQFAIAFYEALRSNNTVAQALQKARLAIRTADPTNSTWLAYSLYAHPNMQAKPTG